MARVDPVDHYLIPRTELLQHLLADIEQGHYFAIYAPRQMGKTTLLQQLQAELNRKAGYIPLTFSLKPLRMRRSRVSFVLLRIWANVC